MLAVTIVSWILLVSCQGCSDGWFGSECQYKCRCAPGSRCDSYGQCQNNKCANGWFGPSCQYQDLAAYGGSIQAPTLTDGDDDTCVPSWVKDSVTVTLNNTYPFSWLRVRLNNPRFLYSLTVTFNGISSCINERTAVVDDKTLDIYCSISERVQSVTLTGEGVQYLCSLYISGGRNVALNQTTTQSSNWSELNGQVWQSNLAVDGNTNTNFSGDSCSHTDKIPKPSTWTVTFSKPKSVNRFAIFNRNENSNRLLNFILTEYHENGSAVFSYRDTDTKARLMYTVISVKNVVSIITVQVTQSDNYLTLCEVEIFGDSDCTTDRFGRDCEHRCNCAGGEACFVSTGRCPSGCAAGYMGENCNIACIKNTWGLRCNNSCSDKCATPTPATEPSCNNVNGDCTNGCQSGYKGLQCTEECAFGKYGPDCAFSCSENCFSVDGSRACDIVGGACLTGCNDGYTGNNCTAPCRPGFYGRSCAYSCSYCQVSNTTGDSACDNVKGICNYGCIIGQTRPECSKEDLNDGSSTSSDKTWLIVGICVGVIAAVVIAVVVAVFLIRRRRDKHKSLYDAPDNPGHDEHQYNGVIGQGDVYEITAMVDVNVSSTPEEATTHQEISGDEYVNTPGIHSLQQKGIETEENENDTPTYEEIKDVGTTDYNNL